MLQRPSGYRGAPCFPTPRFQAGGGGGGAWVCGGAGGKRAFEARSPPPRWEGVRQVPSPRFMRSSSLSTTTSAKGGGYAGGPDAARRRASSTRLQRFTTPRFSFQGTTRPAPFFMRNQSKGLMMGVDPSAMQQHTRARSLPGWEIKQPSSFASAFPRQSTGLPGNVARGTQSYSSRAPSIQSWSGQNQNPLRGKVPNKATAAGGPVFFGRSAIPGFTAPRSTRSGQGWSSSSQRTQSGPVRLLGRPGLSSRWNGLLGPGEGRVKVQWTPNNRRLQQQQQQRAELLNLRRPGHLSPGFFTPAARSNIPNANSGLHRIF